MGRLATIGLWRDNRKNIAHQQARADGIAVIALVDEQGRLDDRQGHEIIDRCVVESLIAGQDEAETASLIVAAGVDLDVKPPRDRSKASYRAPFSTRF